MQVQMFTDSSHFAWLEALQEVPDNNKDWKQKDAVTLPQSSVLVSYPKAKNSNKLVINSTHGQQGLQLAGVTSFELAKNKVEYFGLHLRNDGKNQPELNIILTMNDGSKVDRKIKSAKQGKTNFTGFIADKGLAIKQVEINIPDNSVLTVDRLQWGNLSDVKGVNAHILAKNETTGPKETTETESDSTDIDISPVTCNLKPEVVQYQCDDGQWLFDVQVSGNDPRSSWWCSNDEGEQCASYEKVVSYGYYSKTERPEIELVFTDQNHLSCSKSITVSVPDACEDACSYFHENGKEIKSCERNGELVTTIGKDIFSLSVATKN